MPFKDEWKACGITPAGPRILVKPDEFMESYQGAIVIPDTVKSRSQYAQTAGYVVAVGNTAYQQREFGDGVPWCKVGDRIGFARYGGIVYRGVDGVQYRVISDDDVLTLLSEDVKLDEGSVA